MKRLAQWMFFPILIITLAVSGYATFEVLTASVGINTYIAGAAAFVIDAAAIWLGLHATILAKLGDSTKKVQLATWFVISLSLAVNFLHGYAQGGYVGAGVGIIFPVLAAVLFHFYITHTIREALRERGRILPEKPIYLKSKSYGDSAREEAIERDYVRFTYETAETNLSRMRDNLKPVPRQSETASPAMRQPIETTRQAETEPVSHETSSETERDSIETSETTDETASLVNGVFAAQMLRDINETMTIKEIVEVLVGQGIKDYDALQEEVNKVRDKPVSRETIRKTASRVMRDSETESETK